MHWDRSLTTKNVFPCSPYVFHVSRGQAFVADSAWNENLESLQADWKRKTILLVNELVLFEIHFFHDERPVIPILERKLAAVAH